jgi:NADH dehydrogenase (ubiquinone) 1 beta subcomplex subunit 8
MPVIPLVRRELARRARPSLVRRYATPVKEPNPQLDGYPELPDVSAQYRPPLGWDDKLLRRNFGDTVCSTRVALFISVVQFCPGAPP